MTSLQPKERKIRRHGVVCKIVAVDARQQQQQQQSRDENNNEDTIQDLWDMIPTAVDFEIVGHSVCRIVDPNSFDDDITKDDNGNPTKKISGMKQRIRRWRRMYDPNGEESCLGWGDERFVDLPAELVPAKSKLSTMKALNGEDGSTKKKSQSTEWSSCWVEIHLDPVYDNDCDNNCEDTTMMIQEEMNDLQRLVEKWHDLASDPSTYDNVDVTASSRISKGHPGLYVDPKKLLDRVRRQLGQQPVIRDTRQEDDGGGSGSNDLEESMGLDPTQFLYWVAALINPIPPLGVAPEIRGAILEAPTIQRKIEILRVGLDRSIQNLNGNRPL